MKTSTFVGLSMKSLEYLKFGLPLVNSLRGDTAKFVTESGVGININESEAAKRLASMSIVENEAMRARAKDLFTSTLEVGKIKTTITMIFNEILARGGGKSRISLALSIARLRQKSFQSFFSHKTLFLHRSFSSLFKFLSEIQVISFFCVARRLTHAA